VVKTGHSSFDVSHGNRLLMLLVIADMFDSSRYGKCEFSVCLGLVPETDTGSVRRQVYT